MASKTRTQLKNQSDNTFQDAPPANITPPNHRQFNNDLVDSTANLKTSNVFEDENTFQQTAFFENPGSTAIEVTDGNVNIFGTNDLTNQNGNITATNGEVSGKTGFFNLLKTKIDPNPYNIPVGNNIDLSTMDGNIISITNSGNYVLSSFSGGVEGVIFYAEFIDKAAINPTGAYLTLLMNPGDIVIFQFTTPSEVRYLGIRRYGAQEYFELTSLAAYNELRVDELWQPGAEYVILQCYENPTNKFWDVKVKAIDNATLESAAYIRAAGEWIPVLMTTTDLSPGSLKISGQSNNYDLLTLAEAENNVLEPQWGTASNVVVYGDGDAVVNGQFKSRMFIDSTNNVIKRNVLNLNSNQKSFIGRIEPSAVSSANKFFTHHGRFITAWGNHPLFESGFTNSDLTIENSNLGNEISNVTIHDATYMVVNDLVTINASVSCEGKFNQGVSGHEFLLYFPLPFINFDEIGNGHGSLQFNDISNHETIGAIASAVDTATCLVAAKWSSSINVSTGITINFSFSYITNLN